jgi:anti-sigma regulatory factor (Ser/Thr protein kinase)
VNHLDVRTVGMISAKKLVQATYPAVAASAREARVAVAKLAQRHGATREQLDGIRVAVSEAFTNAIVHAYRDTAGSINLTATVVDGELWVLIADDGCGFQTPSATPGLGWGMPLIAHTSEEFVIVERGGGGTEVRMRFALGPAVTG